MNPTPSLYQDSTGLLHPTDTVSNPPKYLEDTPSDIRYLPSNYFACICKNIGVTDCNATCHCKFHPDQCVGDIHICRCKDYFLQCKKDKGHLCICSMDPTWCRGDVHACVCSLGETCKSRIHACSCKLSLKNCKTGTTKHECTCDVSPEKCIAIEQHICSCKYIPSRCKATKHECSCNNNYKTCKCGKWDHHCSCIKNGPEKCKCIYTIPNTYHSCICPNEKQIKTNKNCKYSNHDMRECCTIS